MLELFTTVFFRLCGPVIVIFFSGLLVGLGFYPGMSAILARV